MVEESDYSTHRAACIPAPAGNARVRRADTSARKKGVKTGGAVFDASVEPRPVRGAAAIGVVLTNDRQLRVVRTTRPRGLRLDGEIDLANVEVVRRVLSSAVRDGGDIRVDVSKLAFIDVAGLRVFTENANALASRGGSLVLVGAGRQLRRVLALCGWDSVPGLILIDRIAPAPRRPKP